MPLFLKRLFLVLVGLWLNLAFSPSATASATIFGGGPFYTGGTSVMNILRSSGYTTVMLWCVHVDATSGNLIYNDQLVVTNGVYVGTADWTNQLKTLKVAPTSVKRIECSVASWGVDDFGHLKTLMDTYGTNTDSIVYRNFLALKNATGADAIDFDDETHYNTNTAVKFGRMLSSMGYKVSLCPYTQASFWQGVYNQLGTNIVDAIYLQCYDGGAGNSPATWNSYFSGMKVQPGLWCLHSDCSEGNTATEVQAQMTTWRSSAGITGGFMWLYDDMLTCTDGGTPADYAAAINRALDLLVVTPTNGFAAVTAFNSRSVPMTAPFTLSNSSASLLSWSVINTSSWLTVSASSGTLAASGTAVVKVNLNPAYATNLPLGTYSASVLFSNHTSQFANARDFTLNTAVLNWPISLQGFNAGVLASNTATTASPGATAFDLANNYCFYQQGLSGSTRGLPLNRIFQSQSDSSTAFQLGPYGTTNVLMMGYTYPKTGTLTLSNPESFNALSILATSANSGGQGTFFVTFTDGTTSPVFAYNCQDWFNIVTNVALQGFGRLKLGSSWAIEDNGSSNPNLYQTTVNLAALGLTQPVASITFSNRAGAGTSETAAILGVSGIPGDISVPPPGALRALRRFNGSLTLTWTGSTDGSSYLVARSTNSGAETVIATVATTNFTDTGLANDQAYYYMVSTENALGSSDYSAELVVPPVVQASGSYVATVIANNPLAYWPLNETNGTLAYDLAGGYDGTYTGGFTLAQAGIPNGGFGFPGSYAALFDGSSGYVSIPSGPFDLTNAITVMAWVNVTTTPAHFSGVVGRGDSSWRLSVDTSGKPRGNNAHVYGDVTGPSSVVGTNWHLIAYTYSGTPNATNNGRLYVDGLPKGTNTVGALPGSTNNVWIGGAPDYTTARLLAGSIAQVAVFTNALTAAQIQTLYSVGTNAAPQISLIPLSAGSAMELIWSGGALLQSTNLDGAWTTNSSVSPVVIDPTNVQMFFKLK